MDQDVKVLIVDDDIPTRILLRAALNQWGFKVIEAGDGEEAWLKLQEEDPAQLVISDWIMPNLDGPGLCERVKKESAHPPYIILLTQLSGTANIVKGLEAGADEFLAKPFNMAELRSRLFVGLRIIKYEKELAKKTPQNTDSSMTVYKDPKQFIDMVKNTVIKMGGTVEEEQFADNLKMVITIPGPLKGKA